jgi:hypothetical protein
VFAVSERTRWKGALRGLTAVAIATVGLATVAAGCGGDDSTAEERRTYAKASEQSRVFAVRMAKLLETTATTEDCVELEEINARSFTRFPCPPARSLSRSMKKFKVVGAEEYGTGAVVDYTSGEVPDGAAIVLYVAPDRNWGIGRFGLVTEPSTETTDDDSREGYGAVVDDYLDAVRTRDCEAFRDAAFIESDDGGERLCRTVFAGTAPLARRLKQNPSAEPRYEGGNATYGFYTLETPKPAPENSTISVMRTGDGADGPYRVLDVTPSPTEAEQQRVQREFERQQQENSKRPGEDKGTGRKAD